MGLNYIEVPVHNLQLGMFVAELDRPWLDTPFLLQGFVLDDTQQIETLCKYCQYVLIDRTRSLPDAQSALPAPTLVEEAAALDPKIRRIRVHAEPAEIKNKTSQSDVPPKKTDRAIAQPKVIIYNVAPKPATPATALKFTELLAQAEVQDKAMHDSLVSRCMSRLGNLFSRNKSTAGVSTLDIPKVDTSVNNPFVPGIELTIYESKRSIEEELPSARVAVDQASTTLKKLITDIRTGTHISLTNFDEVVNNMVDSVIANHDALMWVARLRQSDSQAYNHALKVSIYLIGMGRQIGLPREHLNHLGLIGMLLDVGKLKIPRDLLHHAGALDEVAYQTIQRHVEWGLGLLQEKQALPAAVITGIHQHHERLDGSGYPLGLTDNAISLYGKMAGIVDTFAAMTSPRPYAQAYSPYDALAHLYEWSGRLFHEPLIEKFVQAIGIYPVGSLVELNTGEVAIVLAHNRVRRLQPRVLVLTAPDKSRLKFPRELNLLYQTETIDGQPIRIAAGLPTGSYNLDVRDNYLSPRLD